LLEGGSLFESLILLAKNQADAAALKAELKPLDKKHRVKIVIGNGMREDTLRCVFDLVPRSMTGIALVNPPGYASLRWSVIKKLAQHGVDWQGHKMALCIIFPLEMSLLRNVLRPSCRNSINRLYGTEAWQEIKQRYAARDLDLGWMRRRLIDLFKAQLKQLGYKHVEDVEPARFTNPPYYHVIWAGDGVSRSKELREIWGRERFLTCEMFRE
jgi:three-Cys-motif partner protein